MNEGMYVSGMVSGKEQQGVGDSVYPRRWIDISDRLTPVEHPTWDGAIILSCHVNRFGAIAGNTSLALALALIWILLIAAGMGAIAW